MHKHCQHRWAFRHVPLGLQHKLRTSCTRHDSGTVCPMQHTFTGTSVLTDSPKLLQGTSSRLRRCTPRMQTSPWPSPGWRWGGPSTACMRGTACCWRPRPWCARAASTSGSQVQLCSTSLPVPAARDARRAWGTIAFQAELLVTCGLIWLCTAPLPLGTPWELGWPRWKGIKAWAPSARLACMAHTTAAACPLAGMAARASLVARRDPVSLQRCCAQVCQLWLWGGFACVRVEQQPDGTFWRWWCAAQVTSCW